MVQFTQNPVISLYRSKMFVRTSLGARCSHAKINIPSPTTFPIIIQPFSNPAECVMIYRYGIVLNDVDRQAAPQELALGNLDIVLVEIMQ